MLGMGMGAWTCKPKQEDCNHFKSIMAKQITRYVTTPALARRVRKVSLGQPGLHEILFENYFHTVYIFK